MATPITYTGEDATFMISSLTHTNLGIGDFSLNIGRGVVEQPLVGETGNYFTNGAITVDGSFTNCQFGSTATDLVLGSIINGNQVKVSGSVGANSLSFYFVSCQITGFNLSIGDAGTLTEGSLDYTMLDPYNVTKTTASAANWTRLSDKTKTDDV